MSYVLFFAFGFLFSRIVFPSSKQLKKPSQPVLIAPGYHFIGMPIEREHTEGPECWCHPILFFDGGDQYGNVWVHKGNGEELPPARILIAAVADAIANREEHG